jgi:hypothetical protein
VGERFADSSFVIAELPLIHDDILPDILALTFIAVRRPLPRVQHGARARMVAYHRCPSRHRTFEDHDLLVRQFVVDDLGPGVRSSVLSGEAFPARERRIIDFGGCPVVRAERVQEPTLARATGPSRPSSLRFGARTPDDAARGCPSTS